MASNGWRNARDHSRAGYEKRQKRRQIRVLQEAIDKHDTDAVREVLSDEFDVDFQYRGQTALQLAVKEGCYDICKLLIEKGANVNMADAELNTLLNMACWRGFTDIAELLIQNAATVDDQNIHGSTPVNTCAYRGHADVLQILLAAQADLDLANQHGDTPLHTATRLQNTEITQLLLLAGCKVDKCDENRHTSLALAAELGFADIVKILVTGGATLNSQDRTGSTPLFHAIHNNHFEVVKELISSGADVNLATTKGLSPLLEAIQNSDMDLALLMIDARCDVNQTDRLQQAPIHAAVRKVSQYFSEETEKAMTVVRRLVEAGCDLNVSDQQKELPLYQSACGGNLELTRYLLEKNVELTGCTKNGDTILHGGVHGNQPEVVDLLIQSGCPVDVQNDAGEHPLLTAVVYRANFKIVQSLVEGGSNLNLRDKAHQNTALHNAILHYYPEAAELLIDSGCDVNALNMKRHTPLYVACERNDDKIAQKILQNKFFKRKMLHVRAIPQPLFAAVGNGHVHLVKSLLQTGCDIDMVNTDGLSPVMYALKENHPFVVKLLLRCNCDLEAHAKSSRLMKCCLLHEDDHPHFDLEPMFLALSHRDLEIMELLVKCYYKLPMKAISVLEKVFSSTPDMGGHYSASLKADIQDFFRRCTKQPRKLQEICRALVREKVGSIPRPKVHELPIATKLQDYILMEQEFGDLFENIQASEIKHPTDFHSFQSAPDSE